MSHLRVDGNENEHCNYASRIVVAITAEQLGQRAAECFIDVAESIIPISDLIHPCTYFLVETVVRFQGRNGDGLSNVIRR